MDEYRKGLPIVMEEGTESEFDTRVSPFKHYIEIIYVEDGDVRLMKDAVSFVPRKQEIIISGKRMIRYSGHTTKGMADGRKEAVPFRYRWGILNLDFLCNYMGEDAADDMILSLVQHQDMVFCRIIPEMSVYESLVAFLREAVRIYEEKKKFYELKLKAKCFEFLYFLLEEGCICIPKPEEDKKMAAVKLTLAYIAEHYQEDIKIADIARKVHYSEYYLMKCFKSVTGTTITEYIIKYRLMIAKRLLAMTTDSVTDICYNTGFSNPSYFIRKFSEQFGQTPKQARKDKELSAAEHQNNREQQDSDII